MLPAAASRTAGDTPGEAVTVTPSAALSDAVPALERALTPLSAAATVQEVPNPHPINPHQPTP